MDEAHAGTKGRRGWIARRRLITAVVALAAGSAAFATVEVTTSSQRAAAYGATVDAHMAQAFPYPLWARHVGDLLPH